MSEKGPSGALRMAVAGRLEEGQRFDLWIPGNPIPKGRPRGWEGHYYTPERTREWEEWVGWHARDQFMDEPLKGDLGIGLVFLRGNKTKVDLDNLEKAVLDGLQGILFEDDSQIKEKRSMLAYSKQDPGVIVIAWQIEAAGR